MKKLLIMLAAAAVIPSGGVAAQAPDPGWDAVKSFLDICLVGSLRPCGSVIVKTRLEPVGTGVGTSVQMWVRNEEGGNPIDQTGGSFLTQIGLTAPTIDDTEWLGLFLDPDASAVGQVGTPLDNWEFEKGGLGGQVTMKLGSDHGKDGAIRGCSDPSGSTTEYFITCDDQGYTGWVVFAFTTSNTWSAEDSEVALKYQSIGDEDWSLECRSGDGGGEHACVVPEPETYALILTGLFGIFGMAWVRRREEEISS
jgi:hypothetical protein